MKFEKTPKLNKNTDLVEPELEDDIIIEEEDKNPSANSSRETPENEGNVFGSKTKMTEDLLKKYSDYNPYEKDPDLEELGNEGTFPFKENRANGQKTRNKEKSDISNVSEVE
jgi:hypothetical protein